MSTSTQKLLFLFKPLYWYRERESKKIRYKLYYNIRILKKKTTSWVKILLWTELDTLNVVICHAVACAIQWFSTLHYCSINIFCRISHFSCQKKKSTCKSPKAFFKMFLGKIICPMGTDLSFECAWWTLNFNCCIQFDVTKKQTTTTNKVGHTWAVRSITTFVTGQRDMCKNWIFVRQIITRPVP